MVNSHGMILQLQIINVVMVVFVIVGIQVASMILMILYNVHCGCIAEGGFIGRKGTLQRYNCLVFIGRRHSAVDPGTHAGNRQII